MMIHQLLGIATALAGADMSTAAFSHDAVMQAWILGTGPASGVIQPCQSELSATVEALLRDGLCNEPYTTICGRNESVWQTRRARIQEVQDRVWNASHRHAANQLHYSDATDAGYDSYKAAHPANARRQATAFREGAMKAVSAELNDDSVFRGFHHVYYGRTQRALVAAIERLKERTPGRPEAFWTGLQNTIYQTELVDGLELLSGTSTYSADYATNALRACSRNGLADNAFQPPNSSIVVLCPGMWFAANSTSPVSHLRVTDLAYTVAHELGHRIDAENQPGLLENLIACARPRVEGLSGPNASDYREEISADAWAAETIAIMAGEKDDPLDFVRESLKTMCGSIDDGEHPAARFRVEALMMANPRLRSVLGCSPGSGPRGCALEGAVPAVPSP